MVCKSLPGIRYSQFRLLYHFHIRWSNHISLTWRRSFQGSYRTLGRFLRNSQWLQVVQNLELLYTSRLYCPIHRFHCSSRRLLTRNLRNGDEVLDILSYCCLEHCNQLHIDTYSHQKLDFDILNCLYRLIPSPLHNSSYRYTLHNLLLCFGCLTSSSEAIFSF